jgi:hypothetical protein
MRAARDDQAEGRCRSRLARALLAVAVGALLLAVQQAIEAANVGADPVGPAPVAQQLVLAEPDPTPALRIERPVVVLYGDSLAWESKEHFVQAFAGHPDVQVITRTFGGTAICDWLDTMRADAVELAPGAVMVEFSGNAMTACMQDGNGRPLSGPAYVARYQADAETVIDIFEPNGTPVLFASAPIARSTDATADFKGGELNPLYAEIADLHPGAVEFVDAGAAVLDDGEWTATLPCRADEPCEGGVDGAGRAINVVRAPDGNHFCPTNGSARAGVTGGCAVWSSGAFRYGTAMAAPLIAALAV